MNKSILENFKKIEETYRHFIDYYGENSPIVSQDTIQTHKQLKDFIESQTPEEIKENE